MAEKKDDINNLTVFGYKAPNKTVQPSLPITHWAFVYRPAVATDVTITWRKCGWVPVEIGCKSHLPDILGKGQGCVESIGHLKEGKV